MRLIISASNFGLSGVVSAVYNIVKYLVSTDKYEIMVVGEAQLHYFQEFQKLGVQCVLVRGIPFVKALKLYRLLCRWRPNVFMPGFSAYEYIYLHRVPSVVKIVQTMQSDHLYWYQKFDHVSAFVDAFVFVSDFLKKRLKSKLVCLGAHIPNFVHINMPLESKKFDGDGLQIVYTGRLVQAAKRVLDLPEILKGIPYVRLHLAGEGGEKSQLFSQLDAYGADYVYYGLLGPQALNELYKSSDLFILASEYEGLPLSLIEAMSFACVPIASKVWSGVTEVVNERNGYLVDVGDIAGFRSVLFELVDERGPLHQKSEASIEQVVRRYSDTVCGPQYEEVFRQVLKQTSTHPWGNWIPRPLPGNSLFHEVMGLW